MDLRDMTNQIEMLQLKVNALTDYVYDHLSNLETTVEMKHMERNLIAKQYLIEQQRDVYITATISSDILRDVERIFEELKQENADTSQINTLASDEVPAR